MDQLEAIDYEVIDILPIDEIYGMRFRYPMYYYGTLNGMMNSIKGSSDLLRLALLEKDAGLLNFVVDNLYRWDDLYIVESVLARGKTTNNDEGIYNASSALDTIASYYINLGDTDAIIAMMKYDGLTPSDGFNRWFTLTRVFRDAMTRGPIIDAKFMSSNPVVDAVPSDKRSIYAPDFNNVTDHTEYQIKAARRIYNMLGVVPAPLKRGIDTLDRRPISDDDFMSMLDDLEDQVEDGEFYEAKTTPLEARRANYNSSVSDEDREFSSLDYFLELERSM